VLHPHGALAAASPRAPSAFRALARASLDNAICEEIAREFAVSSLGRPVVKRASTVRASASYGGFRRLENCRASAVAALS